MVVDDRHVDGRTVARFDGDVVVAGADEGLGDGNVLRLRGVDSVGVASVFWGVDLYAPDGETVAAVEGEVGVWRVFQRDAIEGEVVGEVGVDHARCLLAANRARVVGQGPPGFRGRFTVDDDA